MVMVLVIGWLIAICPILGRADHSPSNSIKEWGVGIVVSCENLLKVPMRQRTMISFYRLTRMILGTGKRGRH
jgi:hypothetical protein